MPPKRVPSTKGQAKKAAAPDPPADPPSETDDAKPYVQPSSPEVLAPADSVSTPLIHTAPSTTAIASASTAAVSDVPSASSAPQTTRGRKPQAQPKFSRRSQPKRDELQKAEETRRQAETESQLRAAVAGAQNADRRRYDTERMAGGRGGRVRGRGRGRGGYMGENERGPTDRIASGPFGAGQAQRVDRTKTRRVAASSGTGVRGGGVGTSSTSDRSDSARAGGGNGRGASGSRTARQSRVSAQSPDSSTPAIPAIAADGKEVKQEPGPSSASQNGLDGDRDISFVGRPHSTNPGDGGYISSDDDEEEKGIQRMNVEDLSIIDLTQDDTEYDPFPPVRVQRVQHRVRTKGINAGGATNQEGAITIDANDTIPTTAPSERRRGKQRARDVEVDDNKIFQGTYSDSDSDVESKRWIKRDGSKLDQEPGSDQIKEPPSSPESKRKTKERIRGGALSSETSERYGVDEFEEWQRHQHDLNILREELGVQAQTSLDQGGDISMTDEDRREDKVYLFQFPPVLPDLVPIAVKPDPETTNIPHEAMQVDEPITIDDDTKTHQPRLPSGAVGKLKVHASGRVTLDWGGTSFCLGMGTEASFLQDILVAELPDIKDDDDGPARSGVATSMGQVKGKFVVTPDWEQILK